MRVNRFYKTLAGHDTNSRLLVQAIKQIWVSLGSGFGREFAFFESRSDSVYYPEGNERSGKSALPIGSGQSVWNRFTPELELLAMNIRMARQWVVRLLYSNRFTRAIVRRIALDELCLRDILAHHIFVTRLQHDPVIRATFEKVHYNVNPNSALIERISQFNIDEQRAIIKRLNLHVIVSSLSPNEMLDALPKDTLQSLIDGVQARGAEGSGTVSSSTAMRKRQRHSTGPAPFSESRHAVFVSGGAVDIAQQWIAQLPIDATVIVLCDTDAQESVRDALASSRQVKQVLTVAPALGSGKEDTVLRSRIFELDMFDVVIPSAESDLEPDLIHGLRASGFQNVLTFDGQLAWQIVQGDDAELLAREYALV